MNEPSGTAHVKVDYQNEKKHLDLFAVEKGISTLFGLSWLEGFILNGKS